MKSSSLRSLVSAAVLTLLVASPTTVFGSQFQFDENGNFAIDGILGPPGTLGIDPFSLQSVLVYSLPFAGNAGDLLLTDSTSATSDLIRFLGNGTLEFLSLTTTATQLAAAQAVGATNIKVSSVIGFAPGQQIAVDNGASRETVTIMNVGTAGAAGTGITLTTPLTSAHASGAAVSEPLKLADVFVLPAPVNPFASVAEANSPFPTLWDPGANGIGGGPSLPQYAFYETLVIQPSAVPEPATLLLLGTGLCAVARRRRTPVAP